MNRNIIRIAIIGAAVIFLALILRWVLSASSSHKEPVIPKAVISTAAKDSGLLKEARRLLEEGRKADGVKKLEEAVSLRGGTQEAYESLLLLADTYNKDGNILKAKEIYLAIVNEYPDYCNYSDIQKKLTALNMAILFSPVATPDSEIYVVAPNDSLTKIASRYSTTIDLIKRANRLKSDNIRPGMKLKVQKSPFSIVVDKSQCTLTLLLGNEVIKTYSVSTGMNNSTPAGTFKIKDKLIDPAWYSPIKVIPAGSPENILGSRWMGLSTPHPDGYGIHGTTDPGSIGYQCTEGCVRMKNEDVEELFLIVPMGTEVTIID